MGKYICDDRVNREALCEAIKNMTEDEFEQFQQRIIETNAYPTEFYISETSKAS